MHTSINRTVLMSGPDCFTAEAPINPYMDEGASAVNIDQARAEHDSIRRALGEAGVRVIQVTPPEDCQDGIYTANWALCRGDRAILSRLPNARKGEEAYARQILEELGKTVIAVPDSLRFSGQGDALPCGNYLFMGGGYRTDPEAHEFVGETLGYNVISLQTIPARGPDGQPVINASSGWPDSYFYDIDLAMAILREPAANQRGIIAWCPEAFTAESQQKLASLTDLDQIIVSLDEARNHFACNLVSTGQTAIMGAHAPQLQHDIEARGLQVITPEIRELTKGGGYIRCTTLTLDNA
jgi:N-dimethylarginine dimethylaminohydrolase